MALLTVAYVFSFIDRQMMSMLVQPIRRDLAISDWQMSLLLGFAFALFYALMSIPLGRAADHRSRRGLIGAGLLAWSLMTAASGAARNYWQLFVGRIGVGVGEAALSPAAYSMLADYFPPAQRATAISVYSIGIYLGAGAAYLCAGQIIRFAGSQGMLTLPVVGAIHPWQAVFFVIGAAGALFSLMFLLVQEPPRAAGSAAGASAAEVLAWFRANWRAMLGHHLGFAMISLYSYGSAAWIPSFLSRSYGWDMPRIGVVYGLIIAVCGTAGVVTGGRLTDRWLRQGKTDAALRVGLWAAAMGLLMGPLYVFMPGGTLAAVALAPQVFCLALPFGGAAAAVQEMVPSSMRGQASALYLFVVNLVGLGGGPSAVAAVTDFAFHDDAMLRWSLVIVGCCASLAAIALLAAARAPYREAVARLAPAAAG